MKKSRLKWYVTGNQLFPPAFHISKEFCLTFPLWWQNFPFDIISTKRVFILLPETWWQWLGRNRGENLLTGYFTKFLTPWMWILAVCVCVCVCVNTQPHLTLCGPIECRLAGSSVHEIFQNTWLGVSPYPGELPNPGIEPASLVSPLLEGRLLPLAPPGKPEHWLYCLTDTPPWAWDSLLYAPGSSFTM